MFFSPLEQFNIIPIKSIDVLIGSFYIDVALTNVILPLIIANLLFSLLIFFFKRNMRIIPSIWQLSLEILYNFIYGIIKQQIGQKGYIYFPLIFTLFNFILLCNMFSLMPFGLAITSHIILVIFISSTMCLSIFLIGLLTHSFRFLKIFIPECPFVLLPILIPIELFSYVIRVFSLAIRLAANILAGHTLVYIISSLILKISLIKF